MRAEYGHFRHPTWIGLALAAGLFACDDGGGSGGQADGGRRDALVSDASPDAQGDAGPTDRGVGDQGPEAALAFALTHPPEGAVVAGQVRVAVAALDARLDRISARVGERELGEASAAEGWRLAFSARDLPAGPATLTVRGLDADGAPLGEISRALRVVPKPESAAALGPEGGALATASGILVVIPPGALPAMTALRVVDRPLDTLPLDRLDDRGLNPLLAFDFLPANGPPDPDFRLAVPAQVQFPASALSPSQKQSFGAPDSAGALGPNGSIDFVGGVEAVGDAYVMGLTTAPILTGYANLTAPGQVPRPFDAVALQGRNLSGLPNDLEVLLADAQLAVPTVSTDGTQAIFIVPPDLPVGPVTVRLRDRPSANTARLTIEVGARDPTPPTEAEADALLTLYFDQLDTELARLSGEAFEGDRKVQQSGRLRDRLETELGAPIAFWRAEVANLRDAIAALPAADRQAFATPLVTLPQNLLLMGGGIDQISDLDLCISFKLLQGMAQYWGLVLKVVPTNLIGSLASNVLGMFFESTVAGFDQAFAAGACEDEFRNRGLSRHECDMLFSARDAAEASGQTAFMEGNVTGIGPTSPDDLGLNLNGTGSDLTGPFPQLFQSGWVEAFLAGTQQYAALFDGPINPDGGFRITFVQTDTLVDLVIHLPGVDPPIVIPNVLTPGSDESDYLPIYVPAPNVDPVAAGGPYNPDDAFTLRIGLAAGLVDGVNSGRVDAADLDGDGRLDIDLCAGPTVELEGGEPVASSLYVARQVAPGEFVRSGWGRFDPARLTELPLLGEHLVDVNGDGRPDRVGVAVGDNAPMVINALINLSGEGPFDARLETLVTVPVPDGASPNASMPALAWGDFIPGGGLDLVMVVAPVNGEDVTQPADGHVVLFRNDGGQLTEVSRLPRRAPGVLISTVGQALDLDADAVPEAVFASLRLVVFAEGEALRAVPLPDLCTGTDLLLADDDPHRGAALDLEGTGRLALYLPHPKAVDDGCVLRVDAEGVLVASALELPGDERAVNLRVTDLEGDGLPDLVGVTTEGGLRLWSGRPDGSFAVGDPGTLANLVDVAVGDFSGDGRPDLALAHNERTPDAIAVSRIPPQGAWITVDTGARPGVTITADLDGDGQPDLARASEVGSIVLGVGAAASVTVTAHYAGGEVRREDVAPGSAVSLLPP